MHVLRRVARPYKTDWTLLGLLKGWFFLVSLLGTSPAAFRLSRFLLIVAGCLNSPDKSSCCVPSR